jgi:uncharacterized protein
VPTLHGRLRDVRLYRIALGDESVATIRRNALATTRTTRTRETPPEISTPTSRASRHSQWGSRASPTSPCGRSWACCRGCRPSVPATYAGGAAGDVRVIWPSPTDNAQVLEPGTFTVTGRVPGTRFEPKATVIVSVPVGTTTPPERLVEAFPLDRVVLDRDAQGRETPFIRNRDKFLRGLAATSPDSFLYNFRDAFGQPQPEGARRSRAGTARRRG